MQLLSPRNDAVFKMLFTREPRLLQAMLEAVLDASITSLEILNPESPGVHSGAQSTMLDVRVLLNTSTRVDVEVQIRVTPELPPGLVYHVARDFSHRLPYERDDEKLTPTLLVVWLDHPMNPGDTRFHRVFALRDRQTGDLFSDHLGIHVLYMHAWKAAASSSLQQWARFLTVETREHLATLAAEHPLMRRASHALEALSVDPEAARIAHERERSRYVDRMGFALSRQRTRQEELAEGRRDGLRLAVVRLCAAVGLDIGMERHAQLANASSPQLVHLIDHLVASRTWPSDW